MNRLNQILFFCLCVFIFITFERPYVQAELTISANHAILMEQATARILYEKNAYEAKPIASITKVMTALLAIEYGDLQDEVLISQRASSVEGSSLYLEEGEKMSLEDLLYGLMLRSGNDAAIAIAEHIGGSVEGFALLMNQMASLIGMEQSHFKNPHGLDEAGHLSTAYDVALLMRYAMENPIFREISATKIYRSKNRDYQWVNKNKLLTHLYPYCTGGKTGYTQKAGRTLVTTARKDHHDLIVVSLDATNDWQDHRLLYEYYFDQLHTILFEKKGKRKIVLEDQSILLGRIEREVSLPILTEEIDFVKKQIRINQEGTGNQLGKIYIQVGKDTIYKIPILTYEKGFPSIWEDMKWVLTKMSLRDQDG